MGAQPLQSGAMNRPNSRSRAWGARLTAVVCSVLVMTGCASIVNRAGSGLSRNLTAGVLEQDDTQTVADGLPAYLLLIDGLLTGSPDNADLLMAASKLYGAYAGGFAGTPERQKRLALKAERYAQRAICVLDKTFCAQLTQPFDTFEAALANEGAKQVPALYTLAVARAGVLQADSGDWERIADLPRIEAMLQRVRSLAPDHDGGAVAMYLGVLNCLRPESLGGKPADGVRYFAEALERSGGRNQMARVLDAQYCARLTFDQARHDELLNAVLAADPNAPGLTLMNTIARERARALLESGKDYF